MERRMGIFGGKQWQGWWSWKWGRAPQTWEPTYNAPPGPAGHRGTARPSGPPGCMELGWDDNWQTSDIGLKRYPSLPPGGVTSVNQGVDQRIWNLPLEIWEEWKLVSADTLEWGEAGGCHEVQVVGLRHQKETLGPVGLVLGDNEWRAATSSWLYISI